MNVHASLYADLVVLTIPVGLIRDGHAVPPVWVDGAESVTYAPDDALGEDVGLGAAKERSVSADANTWPIE